MSASLFDHRYLVLEVASEDALTTRTRAIHEALEREVILVQPREELSAEWRAQARDAILAEAHRAASIQHPNLRRLFDLQPTLPCAVYEPLEGARLDAFLEENGALRLRHTWRLLRGALSALFAAHRLGITHMALTPHALFVDEGDLDERLLITGLGERDTPPTGLDDGHAGYLAPEAIERGMASPAMDVYAMGLILCEMLTGRSAVGDGNDATRLERHLRGALNLPPGLEEHPLHEVLTRALARDHTERFPHAGAFLEALEALPSESLDTEPAAFAPTRPDGFRFRSLASIPRVDLSSSGDAAVVPAAEDEPRVELGMLAELFEGQHQVLIVDDDPDMREIIAITLDAMDIQAIEARNGAEGLAKAFARQPDLILVDQLMPKMTGFEFLERLRKTVTTRSIPTIMVTTESSLQDKLTGIKLGADDYVTKPFQPAELLARVGAALRRSNIDKVVNPVTRLPGNTSLSRRLAQQLEQEVPFFFGVVCLRGFTQHLQRRGYEASSTLLRSTARILYHSVTEHGRLNDDLGHLNPYNFGLVLNVSSGHPVTEYAHNQLEDFFTRLDADVHANVGLLEIHNPTAFRSNRAFARHVHACVKHMNRAGSGLYIGFPSTDLSHARQLGHEG